jgi:PDZ domain-containing protein
MTRHSVPISDEPTEAPPVAPSAPADAGQGDGGRADHHSGQDDASGSVRRRRWWIWGGLTVVLLSVVAGVLFIPTPYYLLEPGSVRPAETRVDVEGAKSYDSKGDILFTTVYIDQATLATLVRGWLDDAVEIESEHDVYGDQGRDASQQENQQRMDLSKLIATKVALNYLGHPAEFTGSGATVIGLSKDSPALGKLEVGDVITAVDGTPIATPDDIRPALAAKHPGDVVTVTARRGHDGDGTADTTTPGATATFDTSVTLGSAPVQEADGSTTTVPAGTPPAVRPILGVSVDVDQPRLDSPIQVDIDSGDVTGPSAGLAWALAVVDRMTPGSLTDGKDVAVTGEILADGSVGPIGGITQKVAAVKRAGVKTFIYPASTTAAEQKAMRKIAGDSVQLRPVKNLDEAVHVLEPAGVRADH